MSYFPSPPSSPGCHEAEVGGTKWCRQAPGPGLRSQLQATRHGGGTASAPRAGAIPQPAHHHSLSSSGSPSPAPPNRGSSQHLTPTEACPFSRAQPERGARRDPEEKCITILLVLHSSFPHSAWCSTAIPQIKINKINVLLK